MQGFKSAVAIIMVLIEIITTIHGSGVGVSRGTSMCSLKSVFMWLLGGCYV